MPIYPTYRVHDPELRAVIKQQSPCILSWVPLAPDADYFKTSTALAASQTTTLLAASMTKTIAPLIPVCPTVTITNNVASGETSWTSVAVTFVGVDQFGITQSHTVAAVDSSDTWTGTSLIAFASLTSVAFTVTGGTACDTSDAYTIGYNKTYGLMVNVASSSDVILSNFDSATETGTVSTAYNTYTIAGTPNAVKVMTLIIRSSAL